MQKQGVHKVRDEVLVGDEQWLVLRAAMDMPTLSELAVAHVIDAESIITYSVAHAQVSGEDVVGTGVVPLFAANSTN
jgi:hypothetical protein